MTHPVRVNEDEAWFQAMERKLQQIDTDIKRLWKRLPQSPQAYAGQSTGAPTLTGESGTFPGSQGSAPQGSGTADASGSPDT